MGGPEGPPSTILGAGSVPRFLTDNLRRIGAGLRAELLHPSVEHFGHIQVALLIGGHLVRALELSLEPAGGSPSVKVIAVQVVLRIRCVPPSDTQR